VRPELKKNLHKKGLVEWLKVKALSSSPSNPSSKKKKKNKEKTNSGKIPHGQLLDFVKII
jgi:hypothetical protein